MHIAILRPSCFCCRPISARVGRVQRVCACVPEDLIQGWSGMMGVLIGFRVTSHYNPGQLEEVYDALAFLWRALTDTTPG